MPESIWTETLTEFRDKVGGTEPVPAGVAISAASASLALALLAKVLTITGRRKDFSGDRQRLSELINTARTESVRLTEVADDDVRAFNQYLECLRGGEHDAMAAAVRHTMEVPLKGARSAAAGLELCEEAVVMVKGLTAADLGIAASLLAGAVRAMLLSVEFNIREMKSDGAFFDTVTADRRYIELQAQRSEEAVRAALAR